MGKSSAFRIRRQRNCRKWNKSFKTAWTSAWIFSRKKSEITWDSCRWDLSFWLFLYSHFSRFLHFCRLCLLISFHSFFLSLLHYLRFLCFLTFLRFLPSLLSFFSFLRLLLSFLSSVSLEGFPFLSLLRFLLSSIPFLGTGQWIRRGRCLIGYGVICVRPSPRERLKGASEGLGYPEKRASEWLREP